MMGWIIALLFSALTWIALWRSGRCPRAALEIIAAALLLALAGYGWQGSPGMAGKPVVSTSR
jgi:hypothetical protein